MPSILVVLFPVSCTVQFRCVCKSGIQPRLWRRIQGFLRCNEKSRLINSRTSRLIKMLSPPFRPPILGSAYPLVICDAGKRDEVVRVLETVLHRVRGTVRLQERRGMDGVSLSICQALNKFCSIATFLPVFFVFCVNPPPPTAVLVVLFPS